MKKKIETIFTHTTDEGAEGTLGIDKDGKLYWNNQLVVTEQKVKLQWWVNTSIIVASASTMLLAIIAILNYFGISVD